MDMLGKIPPHSLEAEQSALGAMILDKDAVTEVVELIADDDFYKEAHKAIFRGVIDLYNRNEPVDIVTLSEALLKEGTLSDIGGIEYLSDLTTMGVVTTNAKHYAKIIEEKSMLRRLIKASSEIIEKGFSAEEADHLLDLAEKSIFDISQKKNREGLEAIKEVLLKTYEQIEKLYGSENAITGLSTGFMDLDTKTSASRGQILFWSLPDLPWKNSFFSEPLSECSHQK